MPLPRSAPLIEHPIFAGFGKWFEASSPKLSGTQSRSAATAQPQTKAIAPQTRPAKLTGTPGTKSRQVLATTSSTSAAAGAVWRQALRLYSFRSTIPGYFNDDWRIEANQSRADNRMGSD
jgi:hypothetical protein